MVGKNGGRQQHIRVDGGRRWTADDDGRWTTMDDELVTTL